MQWHLERRDGFSPLTQSVNLGSRQKEQYRKSLAPHSGKVLQHKASRQTKETHTSSRKFQADPGCKKNQDNCLERGNLFTRTWGLDSEKKKRKTCHSAAPTDPQGGTFRHVDHTLSLSFAGCDVALDRLVPPLALLVFCATRHCVPLSQHLGTDQLFPMDAHALASIRRCDESEALCR